MEQGQAYISLDRKAKNAVILSAALMWVGYVLFTFSMPVVLPAIMEQYGTMAYYAILSGVVTLGSCVVTPIGGKLGDRFGRRRVYLIVGTVRVVFLLLCALPLGGGMFFAAYIVESLSNWMLVSYYTAVLSDVTTLSERPRWFGFFGTLNGFGLLVGMLGGGAVADLLGPLHVFWMVALVDAASLVLAARYYPNRPSAEKTKLDGGGMALMGVGLALVFCWGSFGGLLFPRVSPLGIALLAAGLLFLAAFFLYERRADDPLLDFSLLRNRNFAMSCGIYLLIAPMVQLTSTSITLFGQKGLGMSATVSSTLTLPKNILFLILPTFMGAWLGRDTRRFRSIFLLCGAMIAGGGFFAATWGGDTPLALIYAGMLLFGVGTSCQVVSVQPYTQLTVSGEVMGGAMGSLQFASALSGMVYAIIYNMLYNARYNAAMAAGGGVHLSQAIIEVFSFLSVITAVCGVAIVLLTLWMIPRGDDSLQPYRKRRS